MFGGYFVWSETDKVKRAGNTLHIEELLDLYPLPRIIQVITARRVRLFGHAARMGKKRSSYRILMGKPEGNIPLGRRRCIWQDNVKWVFRK
jgi:hypothetical protein